jgi:hypothetical protein
MPLRILEPGMARPTCPPPSRACGDRGHPSTAPDEHRGAGGIASVRWVGGVQAGAGATQFTRMPRSARFAARDMVKM